MSGEIAQRRCAAPGSAAQHQREVAWHVPVPGFDPQHCGRELGRKEGGVQNKAPPGKTTEDSKKPKGDKRQNGKG